MPVMSDTSVAPSTLADVVRAAVGFVRAAGYTFPIMVGEHYVTGGRGAGTPPCVILVTEPGGGDCEMTPAYENGRAGGQRHVCDVIVRAAEPGDDIGRLANAYALSDQIRNAVQRATAGKITPGRPSKPYPTPWGVDGGPGVQIAWGFSYDRDIAIDTKIWSAPPATAPTAEPKPYGTPGETGTLDVIAGSVTAQE